MEAILCILVLPWAVMVVLGGPTARKRGNTGALQGAAGLSFGIEGIRRVKCTCSRQFLPYMMAYQAWLCRKSRGIWISLSRHVCDVDRQVVCEQQGAERLPVRFVLQLYTAENPTLFHVDLAWLLTGLVHSAYCT